eukprot:TRINITY_DN12798_c0_g1_i1.p1 TRINITY_DN12798_c0_g1~~TRINITY_DN12798_c0_g1_i1.p1  ORF type:complete len:689 (+),score=122.51 TRINITY_DN12798_c0_g1_i1:318-2384(+)
MQRSVTFTRTAADPTLGISINPGRLLVESATRNEFRDAVGRVITSVNGEPCSTKDELQALVDKCPTGTITMTHEEELVRTAIIPTGATFDVFPNPPIVIECSPVISSLRNQLILTVDNKECFSSKAVNENKRSNEAYVVTHTKAPAGYLRQIEQLSGGMKSSQSSAKQPLQTITFERLPKDTLGVTLDQKSLRVLSATRPEFSSIIGSKIVEVDGVRCHNISELSTLAFPPGKHVVSYKRPKTEGNTLLSPTSEAMHSLSPNNGTVFGSPLSQPSNTQSGSVTFERLPTEGSLGVTIEGDTLIVENATREEFKEIIGKKITHVDGIVCTDIATLSPLITTVGWHTVRYRELIRSSRRPENITFHKLSSDSIKEQVSDTLQITNAKMMEFQPAIGSIITHINNVPVSTKADIPAAIPSSGNVTITLKAPGGEIVITRKEKESFGANVSASLEVVTASKNDVKGLVGKRITSVNDIRCKSMRDLTPLVTSPSGGVLRIKYEDIDMPTKSSTPNKQQTIREQQEIAQLLSKVRSKDSKSSHSSVSSYPRTLIYSQTKYGALLNNVTLGDRLEVVDVQEPDLYPLVGATIKKVNNIAVNSTADLERLVADRASINVAYVKGSSNKQSPHTSHSQSSSSSSKSGVSLSALLPIPPSVGASSPVTCKQSIFSFRCTFQDFTSPHLYKKGSFRGF